MSQSASRQQRKKMERELKRKQMKTKELDKIVPIDSSNFVTKEDLNLLIKDMQKVLNYAKLIDNHIWMLGETLTRKDILKWSDVNDTEDLYKQKDGKKQLKIKEILEQDLTIPELMEAVKDDPSLPGYEKLEINLVQDLNINPYEIAVFLKESNPDLSNEEYIELGKKYGVKADKFSFKKD